MNDFFFQGMLVILEESALNIYSQGIRKSAVLKVSGNIYSIYMPLCHGTESHDIAANIYREREIS